MTRILQSLLKLQWLLVVGVVWLIAISLIWFQVVYKDPQRVFHGMLANNLATTGFTHQVNNQQNGLTSRETARVQTGAQTLVQARTELIQGNDKVTTEAITTPQQEFVKYLNIQTKRKAADGKAFNFNKALNVWAKTDTGAGMISQSISQQLLGVFPAANLAPQDRAKVLKLLKEDKAFKVDYSKVKKTNQDGRQLYTYNVQLQPQPYIEILRTFGTAAGLKDQIAQLNPADYAAAAPTNFNVTVDVLSRHLSQLTYQEGGRTEAFAGHGITYEVPLPRQTIASTELQQRLTGSQ